MVSVIVGVVLVVGGVALLFNWRGTADAATAEENRRRRSPMAPLYGLGRRDWPASSRTIRPVGAFMVVIGIVWVVVGVGKL